MDGINFSDGANLDQLPAGGVVPVRYGTQGQLIRFYQRAVLVPFESNRQGVDVYRNADYLKISTPGEHDEIDREATDFDKVRYRPHWQAYIERREDVPTGAKLENLFPADPAIVEGLKGHKVHTVEQLAALSDHQVQNMPLGGLEWRGKAQRFLEVTRDAGRFGELEQSMKALAETVKRQDDEKQALLDRIAELEAARNAPGESVPPSRGRRAA